MEEKSKWKKIKGWYEKYERHISSGALFLGFIVDSLTLRRIDFLLENIAFLAYIFLAGISIIFINLHDSGRLRGNFFEWLKNFLTIVMQFSFGALFSGFFVFYSRSGTIAGSWIFLLILLSLLIGNELFRKRYSKLTFQVSIFFITLFSYSILSIPVLLQKMGEYIFVLSGVISLAIVYTFLKLLFKISPQNTVGIKIKVFFSVICIFIIMNVMYFTNIIPPVPLSLKHVGVYHNITPLGKGVFDVSYEEKKWYEKFSTYEIFKWQKGDRVYVLSSVFAPTNLSAEVVHNWQYYDENSQSWISINKIKYPIYGGKGTGYKGYSYKQGVFPGKWRVDIETERGQLVGRKKIKIVETSEFPILKTDTK